jgi:DNA-binding response OmpR family regulator
MTEQIRPKAHELWEKDGKAIETVHGMGYKFSDSD